MLCAEGLGLWLGQAAGLWVISASRGVDAGSAEGSLLGAREVG